MPTPLWLQHPVTVFLLPLVTLLCLPQLYTLLPYATNPSYDEAKLQRIVNTMDDIYTTLANATFIPRRAIVRGPHQINTTAITCKPSASVLRLLELLPYVDRSLVHNPDWIYGGHFMDYRDPQHLAELCDPLRGADIRWTDYMSHSDVALTNWGTGGWNNDNTWVMLYNTEKDAIRIYDGEMWVTRVHAQRELGEEMHGWWFEDGHGFEWDREDGAPHILRAIVNNYRSLKWTPWETSNSKTPFGFQDRLVANHIDTSCLDNDYVKELMKKNNWPHAFDAVGFSADVVRAKQAPRSRTMIEALQAHIKSLLRSKAYIEDRLAHRRKVLAKASTEDRRWDHRWDIQRREWNLEDKSAELSLMEQEKAESCPNSVCAPNSGPILWQEWALSKKLEVAEHTNYTETCDQRFRYLSSLGDESFKSPTVSEFEACLANEESNLLYLRRAHLDSKADALKYCEEAGCQLLSAEDVHSRANLIATKYGESIAAAKARIAKGLSFASQLPPDTKAAQSAINISITHLERDIQTWNSVIEHITTLIDRAKEGDDELYKTQIATFELRSRTEDGDDEAEREIRTEYQKWMWLKHIQEQKQAENKGRLGDSADGERA